MKIEIETYGPISEIVGKLPKTLSQYLEESLTIPDLNNLDNSLRIYKARQFYTGAMSRVLSLIKKAGHEPVVSVQTLEPKYPWQFKGKYREGQEEMIEALLKVPCGYATATMGFGKSVVIAGLLTRLGHPSLVITFDLLPMRAVIADIEKWSDVPLVVWAEGSKPTPKAGECVVAHISTLWKVFASGYSKQLEWLIEKCRYIVVDECHHGVSSNFFNALNEMVSVVGMYGLTGTFTRADDLEFDKLRAVFGSKPEYDHSFATNVELGNSVPIDFIIIDIPPKKYHYTTFSSQEAHQKSMRLHQVARNKQYQKVIQDYIIQGSTGRNRLIKEVVQTFVGQGKTVAVIVGRIEHADLLAETIPGLVPIVASGQHKVTGSHRKELLDQFNRRKIKAVVSTVLDEGVNIPTLDVVVIAAGGKAEGLNLQRLRNTRSSNHETVEGLYIKERATVVYLYDHADYLAPHSAKTAKLYKDFASTHKANTVTRLLFDGKNIHSKDKGV